MIIILVFVIIVLIIVIIRIVIIVVILMRVIVLITPAQNPNSEFLVDPIGSDPIHYSSVALVVFQFQAFYSTWPTLDCFLTRFA